MNVPIEPAGKPWRFLILDRDSDDPLWVIATVTLSTDVRPAAVDEAGQYRDWEQVTQWAREAVGRTRIGLTPVPSPLVWLLDEDGHPR